MKIEEMLHKRFSFFLIDQDISKNMQIWKIKDTNNNVYILKKIINCKIPLKELSTINSKHFPTINEWYTENNITYIIEKFIHGKRIDTIKHFSIDKIKDITVQICEALQLIHKRSIIHRDIRFKNILIDNNGNVVLINFENATFIQKHDNTKTYRDTRDLGSIEFSAPEQFCKGMIDERTDIFSLGIVFKSVLEKINNDILISEYKYLIDKCTEFDPKYRFQSAIELKNEIQYEYLKKEIIRKKNTYRKIWYLYFFFPYFIIFFYLLFLLLNAYFPSFFIPADRDIYILPFLFSAIFFLVILVIKKQYSLLRRNRNVSIILNGFICVVYYQCILYSLNQILYDGDNHAMSTAIGNNADLLFLGGHVISFAYGYIIDKIQFSIGGK